jgi:hypothetical protein
MRTRSFALAAFLVVALGPGRARAERLADLAPEVLDLQAAGEVAKVKRFDAAVGRILGELKARAALFARPEDQALAADERREVLQLFSSVLDHTVALDRMAAFHFDFWKINPVKDPARHARHFALAFAAMCERQRLALAFVDVTQDKPQFEKLFDEGEPALGIPRGAYARLKYEVVHVDDVSTLMSAFQYHKVLAKTAYGRVKEEGLRTFVKEAIDVRYAEVQERLQKRGVKLFAKQGKDILKDTGHKAWFPVQAEVAEQMGDTKVRRRHDVLIDAAFVDQVVAQTRTGDILVERQNWYLSNVGLPGFWPHAQLWLGAPAELAAFFDGDVEVERAYGKRFVQHLVDAYPDAWRAYATPDEHGAPHRVVEAISEGVSFTTAEHALHADYSAAMRPRLSKLDVARAVERAFGYAGRPYDFDFDFYTDQTLVCSELVYKAYEPRTGVQGLQLPLERVVGRMTLGPNSIVRLFDAQYGTAQQQLDFVWFLDGSEEQRTARFATLDDFRASHARPKWDVAQK